MIEIANSKVLPVVTEHDASHLCTDGAISTAVQSSTAPVSPGPSDNESVALSTDHVDTTTTCDESDEARAQGVHGNAENRRGKAGAPKGNRNRFKHGLRRGMIIGGLPPDASGIKRTASEHRRVIESAALDVHGTLGPYQNALVQSATRHEVTGLLAMRWLRMESKGLSLADRLALLRQIQASTDGRDRCLKALQIDRAPRDANPWNVLRMQQAAATGPERDGAA